MSRSPTIAYMRLFPILETYQISTGTMISRERFTNLCELFIAISDKVAPLDADLADTTLEALDNFMERNTPDFLYDIVLLNIEFDPLDLFFQIAEPNPVQLDISDLDTSDLTQSDLENLDFSNLDSESLDPNNICFSDLDYNCLDLPCVDTSTNLETIPATEVFEIETDSTSPGYPSPFTAYNS